MYTLYDISLFIFKSSNKRIIILSCLVSICSVKFFRVKLSPSRTSLQRNRGETDTYSFLNSIMLLFLSTNVHLELMAHGVIIVLG